MTLNTHRSKHIAPVSLDGIDDYIYVVRGHNVMLDTDLALLYQVSVRRLKEQVKRNHRRFPDDFLMELSVAETIRLLSSRSQNATLKRGHNIKYGSFVFTEEGVSILSGVLHSDRAIEANVAIMRAFVRMRRILSSNRELARKLEELENKLVAHDDQIKEIVRAIRRMMEEPIRRKPKIGYLT